MLVFNIAQSALSMAPWLEFGFQLLSLLSEWGGRQLYENPIYWPYTALSTSTPPLTHTYTQREVMHCSPDVRIKNWYYSKCSVIKLLCTVQLSALPKGLITIYSTFFPGCGNKCLIALAGELCHPKLACTGEICYHMGLTKGALHKDSMIW